MDLTKNVCSTILTQVSHSTFESTLTIHKKKLNYLFWLTMIKIRNEITKKHRTSLIFIQHRSSKSPISLVSSVVL